MADAVKRLFPSAQVDVGRSDHSEKFEYDFLVERPFTPEDLEQIEKEMAEDRRREGRSSRARWSIASQAQGRFFEAQGEQLKLSRLADIPEGEPITLCSAMAASSISAAVRTCSARDQIGAFRADRASPARTGAATSGTRCSSASTERRSRRKRSSPRTFKMLEEARARDHRKLRQGTRPLHVPRFDGHRQSPFSLPRGAFVYNGLVAFIRELYTELRVRRSHHAGGFLNPRLFETSGHLPTFSAGTCSFSGDRRHARRAPRSARARQAGRESREPGAKADELPRALSGHLRTATAQLFYRELPWRVADFGRLHRYERGGVVHGLTRVRTFAQDDAHIFLHAGAGRDRARIASSR